MKPPGTDSEEVFTTHMPLRELASLTMALSLLLPFFYCILPEREERVILLLYLGGLAMAPFYALLRRAAVRTKTYGAFALRVALTAWAGGGFALLLGRFLFSAPLSLLYALVMGVLLLVAACDAGAMRRNRIRRRKAREENDISFVGSESLFTRPRPGIFVWHLIAYLWGLSLHSPMLCDIALAGAVLYLPLLLSHRALQDLGNYLSDMHAISNIPTRRIRRVTRVLLTLTLTLLFVLLSLSLPARGLRPYFDIREWKLDLSRGEAPPLMGGGEAMGGIPQELLELMAENAGNREPSKVLTVLFYVLVGASLFFLLRLIVLSFLAHAAEFRAPSDEGDVIIPLTEEEVLPEKMDRKKKRAPSGAEGLRIRRLYKRTIEKRLKSAPPLPPETPTELEGRAGLLGTAEGTALHEAYAKARYGREKETEMERKKP